MIDNSTFFSIFGINSPQEQARYNAHVSNWTVVSYNFGVVRYIPNLFNPVLQNSPMGYFTDFFKITPFAGGWEAIPTAIAGLGLSFIFRRPDGSYSNTAPI
jgi:hypothetical protein